VLVGLGDIGMGYDLSPLGILSNQTMTHLKALNDSQYYSVRAVVDTDNVKLLLAREIYSVTAVENLVKIDSPKKINLLTVATSTLTHVDVVESLPSHLIPKILLIEKPAGANSEECSRIAQWAAVNSSMIFVNYFRRFLPKVKDARAFVSGLSLGKLLSVSIDSYGTLLNIFSHFMDLSLTVTGVQLFCSCQKLTLKKHGSASFMVCMKCMVEYSFIGLGHPKKSTQIKICFENYQIDIELDGRKICILESDGVELVSFETSEAVYANYQQVVYSAIMNFSEDSRYLAGLDQAFQIHRFVESLDSKT